ncbi:T9SS type A sorting domain-containing protein [Hymenobacter rubripertinctus]|uniref:T9SS C-terminal target domain-containing protein n=1 Tax=Hymenobacter rubripertinctus TaxID=2029981 RepID=A0A418QL96_9BACT|nr:T9SS type A sorting domain-containing protein [Hymenobacter rubripertinctus]RIY06033.1 T9SS C-terminal target domain-containing protein [Hymenobacter rubripertinctus]
MKTLHLYFSALVLGSVAGTSTVQAQALDFTFAAPNVYAPGTVYSVTEQPDGKLLAVGNFSRVNGTVVPRLVRFSANGTLDAAFNQQVGSNAVAYRARLQSNGQYLLVGFTNSALQAGGVVRAGGLLRLNADGSGDPSFDAGSGPAFANGDYAGLDDVLPLANGQMLAVGFFDQFNGVPANHLVRLNADGSVDATFRPGTGANDEVLTVVPVANGKFLIGGYFETYNGFSCNGLARLNADGSFDTSFASPLQLYSGVDNLTIQPDGKVLVVGYLSTNSGSGTPTPLLRLLANGALDNSFFFPGTLAIGSLSSYYGDALAVQNDGKILIRSTFERPVMRLNGNGTPDLSYNAVNDATSSSSSLTLLRNGQLLEAGAFTSFGATLDQPLVRLTTTGSLDATFQPVIQVSGTVNALLRQADGKLVAGGNFSEVNGQQARRLARFNPDGSLDPTFTYNTRNALNQPVYDLAWQSDGRVLVAAGPDVARYLPSGSPDNSFAAARFSGPVTRLLLQPDGRVLAGGNFRSSTGTSIVRLTSTGSYDPTFALSPTTNTDGLLTFSHMALQADGKLVVGGRLRAATGSSYTGLVRYATNGSLDPTFSSSSFTTATGSLFAVRINTLTLQTDGKVLVGGSFAGFNGVGLSNLARLNPNGSLDTGFSPPASNGTVSSVAVQPNNRILVGGLFASPTTPANLARLLPDGSPDASFGATAVPNSTVRAILTQPDGSLIIGGSFTSVSGQLSMALARLVAPNVLHVAAPAAVAERTTAWPVPAHGQLHVALAPTAHARQLELLDALGRPVRQLALASSVPFTLSLAELPAGIYLLRVTYAEGTVTRRVQLQ